MIVINFSHPLTALQCEQIESLTGKQISETLDVTCHFQHEAAFAPQICQLVDQIDLSSKQWQIAPLVINPPSYAPITATLIAELHGRMGYFPVIVRIRPIPHNIPPQYEVAELINLQALREHARIQRGVS